MKSIIWSLLIGSLITNAAWIFRARIKSWLQRKDPLAEANAAMTKPKN
jgi:hypothetical protein